MSLLNTLKANFTKVKTRVRYARFLNGNAPVFSQFGDDVYTSELVQQCMSRIADEMRKVQLNHVIQLGGSSQVKNSSLNRILEYGVNEHMTRSDFMDNITRSLLKTLNAFIYPQFSYKYDAAGNLKERDVIALYPLNPVGVTFYEDDNGRLYVNLRFKNDEFIMPYDSLIHWRMGYSDHEYMGGDIRGSADVEDMLQSVKTYHTLLQGLGIAVEQSLQIKGILKLPGYLDEDTQKKNAEEFEKKLKNSNSGIVAMDGKGEYIPLKADPKLVDKDTLEFLETTVLRHFGCSLPILNGTATPEEHAAFYQIAIEPKLISLEQAMSKALFTPTQFSFGNRIKIYPEELVFLNTNQKIEFVKLAGDRGALTNNKILEIFGLPPYEGGDVRLQSLNYVDVDIANKYQLANAGANKGKGASDDK